MIALRAISIAGGYEYYLLQLGDESGVVRYHYNRNKWEASAIEGWESIYDEDEVSALDTQRLKALESSKTCSFIYPRRPFDGIVLPDEVCESFDVVMGYFMAITGSKKISIFINNEEEE